MLYVSIFIFLLMLVLNILFKFASIFRLGVPLAYAMLVSILFPKFVEQHETLTMVIFIVLLALVALSWVHTIRKKIHARQQHQRIG